MMRDITSDVWLGDRPEDWRSTRIKRISRIAPSFSRGNPTSDEESVVVPMAAVSAFGRVDTSAVESFEDVDPGLNLFENGDVLFAKITPCMENGKGAYVEDLPARYAFGSTEFLVLRPTLPRSE